MDKLEKEWFKLVRVETLSRPEEVGPMLIAFVCDASGQEDTICSGRCAYGRLKMRNL